MSRTVDIRVEELRGEEGDPDERNINLVINEGDFPPGPLAARRVFVLPGFELLAISALSDGGEAVSEQELRGEPGDTGQDRFLVMSKSLVGASAGDTLTGTLYERQSGSVLIVEVPEQV